MESPALNSKIKRFLPFGLLLSAALFVYWNSFSGVFLWDDEFGIVVNAPVRAFGPFLDFFTDQMYAGAGYSSNYWRPLPLVIFSFLWHFFDGSVIPFHVVNTLLHAANTCFFFLFFRRLFDKTIPAFLAAFVFAVHPLNTEAIAYMSGIADPLAAFFMLLGANFYVRARKNEKHGRLLRLGTFLSFILALLSKESALMMPALLLLSDMFAERKILRSWKDTLPFFRTSLPLFFTAGMYIFLRLTIFDFSTNPLFPAQTFFERLLSFSYSYFLYLSLLFAPLHLHMERILPPVQSAFAVPVSGGILLFAASLFLAKNQFNKRPEVSFGLAWFFIALLPNANIFFGSVAPIAEHWLYLSLPAFFFALFSLTDELFVKENAKWLFVAVLSVWVGWLSALTIERNRDWANPIALYTATLRENPKSHRILANLGNEYQSRGEYGKALKLYEKSIKVQPNNTIAYANIGKVYLLLGNEEKALWNLRRSLEISPIGSPAFGVLLQRHMMKKEYEKAQDLLENRIKYLSDDPLEMQKMLLLLSRVAEKKGDTILQKQYEKMFDDIAAEEEGKRNGAMDSILTFLFP